MDRRGDPMQAGSLPPRPPRVPVTADMRVLAAIAGLLILVVVGITIAVWLILDLRRATVDFTEREVEYAAAVGDIALISKTLANDERGYLISGSDEFLRQWEGRTAQVDESYSRAYANANPDQWLAVDRARKSFEEWHRATAANMAAYGAGQRDEAIEASLEQTRTLRKAYETQLAAIESLATFAIETASQNVSDTLGRSVAILIAYLVVALLIGVLIATWLVRRILQPIHDMVAVLADADESAARRLRDLA